MLDSGYKYSDPNREPDQRKVLQKKSWTVGEMWEVHHEIARLILLGWKNVEIAKRLKCSSQMVSNVRNSPVVQDKLAIMKGARDADSIDLSREIRESAPDALRLLQDIIRGDNDAQDAPLSLRAKTAESMMDRAGYSAPKRIQSESISYALTKEEIEEIKRRAYGNDDIIEGEIDEDE